MHEARTHERTHAGTYAQADKHKQTKASTQARRHDGTQASKEARTQAQKGKAIHVNPKWGALNDTPTHREIMRPDPIRQFT